MTLIDWLFLLLIGALFAIAMVIDAGIAEERRRTVLAGIAAAGAGIIFLIFSLENKYSFFFGELLEDEASRARRLAMSAGAYSGKRRGGRLPPHNSSGPGDGNGLAYDGGGQDAGVVAAKPDADAVDDSEADAGGDAGHGRKKRGGTGGGGGDSPVGTGAAETTAASKTIKDCDFCPPLVEVPPGTARLGSESDEPGHVPNEAPVRYLEITRPLLVSQTEITVQQFEHFVTASGHSPARQCVVGGRLKDDHDYTDPGYPIHPNLPVTCVSWFDAKAYANWLGSMTGKAYRLLSEAEWEHAARGSGSGPYAAGDTIGIHAAAFDDDVHETLAGPLAVGSHPPNAFNLYDMAGNVWELVEDCWSESHKDVALDGRPILTGGDCRFRVMKGGAWYNEMALLRPANRWANPARTAGNGVGFRVVRP